MPRAASDDDPPGAAPAAWLFGYGSLIWRPDLPFVERAPACLEGFARRFWQRSTDHRGTPAAPGRVVTLVPAEGARTRGVAYRLAAPAATLAAVDVREQQGYARRALPVDLADGRRVEAVVYVAAPGNPWFVGPEPLEATAAVVATARGPSGANLAYAEALVRALDALGDDDGHARAVLAAARAAAERGPGG